MLERKIKRMSEPPTARRDQLHRGLVM